MFSLDQKIKALYREKDILASDSEDRVKLDMKKEEFESCKRKQKKLQVLYSFFCEFSNKFIFIICFFVIQFLTLC